MTVEYVVIDCAETARLAADDGSDCGELNALAVQWIDRADAELGQYLTASSLAEFHYETNLTEHNQQQVHLAIAVCVCVLCGRITGRARLTVCLSVCPVRTPNSNRMCRKPKLLLSFFS